MHNWELYGCYLKIFWFIYECHLLLCTPIYINIIWNDILENPLKCFWMWNCIPLVNNNVKQSEMWTKHYYIEISVKLMCPWNSRYFLLGFFCLLSLTWPFEKHLLRGFHRCILQMVHFWKAFPLSIQRHLLPKQWNDWNDLFNCLYLLPLTVQSWTSFDQ